jgi:hypothetical protein
MADSQLKDSVARVKPEGMSQMSGVSGILWGSDDLLFVSMTDGPARHSRRPIACSLVCTSQVVWPQTGVIHQMALRALLEALRFEALHKLTLGQLQEARVLLAPI